MSCLFGFGDSWPQGSELSPGERTFVELLAQRLGLDQWHNFAKPSTSIPHLILQFRQALDHANRHGIPLDQCLGVFFLTSPHRDLIWSQTGEPVELHLNPAHPEDTFWYSTVHSTHLVNYRINTTLIALQSLCRHYGLRDYYIWGWESIETWPEVDQSRIHDRLVIDYYLDPGEHIPTGTVKIGYLVNNRNRYIWPNQGHPNQLGHAKIAEVLADWIKI